MKEALPKLEGVVTKALDIQVGGDHYKKLAIQPIEFCHRNKLGPCESLAIKHIVRHQNKNGREDVEKAIHYLQILLEFEYPETAETGEVAE